MAPIGQLPKLNWLDVSNTAVTNAGMQHLCTLRLNKLMVKGSQVTADGLHVLAKKRPMLLVDNRRVKYWIQQKEQKAED